MIIKVLFRIKFLLGIGKVKIKKDSRTDSQDSHRNENNTLSYPVFRRWWLRRFLNLIGFLQIIFDPPVRLSHFLIPVSYTHLTLPTILLVQISVVAVSLKKKN
eukprot:TRINITY_DN20371_c0_g1_i1.p3 TRINITY_DN20371_c0_g1~~TRINITY_DN20371_c0_g1_i1.p3  ORF type:complete len:103 (+),score=12.88 TRINITY_DN20371_c0_g1_i1:843-1151(+)